MFGLDFRLMTRLFKQHNIQTGDRIDVPICKFQKLHKFTFTFIAFVDSIYQKYFMVCPISKFKQVRISIWALQNMYKKFYNAQNHS